jgi:hypothetical protein
VIFLYDLSAYGPFLFCFLGCCDTAGGVGWGRGAEGGFTRDQADGTAQVLKIFLDFWAGRVAQVVEGLPCKCDALSSSPSTTKKKM